MNYPLFGFTGQNSPDQSQAGGMQQYLMQGQMGINPGQQQIAASDPLSAAGKSGFVDALKAAFAGGPPGAQPPTTPQGQAAAYNTMDQGAMMQPNSPSNQNMGGVGPTMQNMQALQNPSYQQQLAALLQGGNS